MSYHDSSKQFVVLQDCAAVGVFLKTEDGYLVVGKRKPVATQVDALLMVLTKAIEVRAKEIADLKDFRTAILNDLNEGRVL